MREPGMNRPRLYLDIETIPDQSEGAQERAKARITAPGNYKDPEKIAAYIEERAADAWLKTALSGWYGQMVAVAWAVNDDPVSYIVNLDEHKLLTTFWRDLGRSTGNDPLFVGHKIADFDLPFLYQRSIINRVIPTVAISPSLSAYSHDVFDTSYEFTGDRHAGIKLDELSEILRIENRKPDGLNGSDVWGLVQAGELERVGQYCAADVAAVREIYKLMRRYRDALDEDDLPF